MNISRGIVRDGRTLPFFIVTKDATARLAERFSGRQLAVARSVYFGMLEAANRLGGDTGSFSCERRKLADLCGVSPRTITEYADLLQQAGVLIVERTQIGDVNLPNTWTVIEPADDAGDDPLLQQPPDPSSGSRQRVAQQPLGIGEKEPPEEQPKESSPAETRETHAPEPAPALEVLALPLPGDDPLSQPLPQAAPSTEVGAVPARKVTYRGRRVPDDVAWGAEHLLAVFCEVTGRRVSPFTGQGKPSSALTQILGVMLDRPDTPVGEWEAGIRAVAQRPPDWISGPWQIGHMFGPRSADGTIAAAQAATSAGASATVGHVSGRRGRERADAVRSNIEQAREAARNLREGGPQ